MARILYRDLVVPARTILPPRFPGYDVNVEVYKYDPQKARQLLAESKYASKLPRITLTLPGSFGATIDPGTEAILEMWRQNLGVQVDVQQTEWATFLQDAKRHRFQTFGGLGWVADYPDPENFLDVLFHSKSVTNDSEYNNPEVDRLLEQARGELDQKARFELYHRIKKMILQDAPWVPLFHTGEHYVLVKPYLKDWLLPPLIIPKLQSSRSFATFTSRKRKQAVSQEAGKLRPSRQDHKAGDPPGLSMSLVLLNWLCPKNMASGTPAEASVNAPALARIHGFRRKPEWRNPSDNTPGP